MEFAFQNLFLRMEYIWLTCQDKRNNIVDVVMVN